MRWQLLPALLAILWLPAVEASTVTIEVEAGRVLETGVVYLVSQQPLGPQREPAADLVQVERQFSPYIRVIQRGSHVRFPNRDPFAHHVYSFSEAKRFELPLYKGTAIPEIHFDKSGVVILGCNIHDWMVGYILVLDTPFYQVLTQGRAILNEVPVGDYEVHFWHPGQGSVHQPLHSPKSLRVATGDQTVTLTLTKTPPPMPQPPAPAEMFDEEQGYTW